MTKTEKVLEVLEKRGDRGIHSFDLIRYGGLRAGARVHDLKKAGHQISAITEKKGDSWGVRYFLHA